ncbi:hypothetical protein NHE_0300 [Neorickettsia helminthoeca str. Oregon]|uniref:Uncharacterized protein n=1 Tax=Neorickettsia helminthoeca str. Oregon TaxID=1286528 RepID=X5HJJ2_9RICK|nr:hypothetical protein [Neorickettsia helminthoeca]AHX11259.1 hypothetical protein NHE_0300 [Neorickettsia helminthoeca str. Oregon]
MVIDSTTVSSIIVFVVYVLITTLLSCLVGLMLHRKRLEYRRVSFHPECGSQESSDDTVLVLCAQEIGPNTDLSFPTEEFVDDDFSDLYNTLILPENLSLDTKENSPITVRSDSSQSFTDDLPGCFPQKGQYFLPVRCVHSDPSIGHSTANFNAPICFSTPVYTLGDKLNPNSSAHDPVAQPPMEGIKRCSVMESTVTVNSILVDASAEYYAVDTDFIDLSTKYLTAEGESGVSSNEPKHAPSLQIVFCPELEKNDASSMRMRRITI